MLVGPLKNIEGGIDQYGESIVQEILRPRGYRSSRRADWIPLWASLAVHQ